jgi:hypothetical protein
MIETIGTRLISNIQNSLLILRDLGKLNQMDIVAITKDIMFRITLNKQNLEIIPNDNKEIKDTSVKKDYKELIKE